MRKRHFWLCWVLLVVSLSSCSRYFQQTGTVVSTRFENGYGVGIDCDPAGEGETSVSKIVEKVTRYRSAMGFEWEERVFHSSEPVPGGLATLENEMFAAAQRQANNEPGIATTRK